MRQGQDRGMMPLFLPYFGAPFVLSMHWTLHKAGKISLCQPMMKNQSINPNWWIYKSYLSSHLQKLDKRRVGMISSNQEFKSIRAFLSTLRNPKSPFKARCCIQVKDSTIEDEILFNIQFHTSNSIYNLPWGELNFSLSFTFTFKYFLSSFG